jgi:hypothetical protein
LDVNNGAILTFLETANNSVAARILETAEDHDNITCLKDLQAKLFTLTANMTPTSHVQLDSKHYIEENEFLELTSLMGTPDFSLWTASFPQHIHSGWLVPYALVTQGINSDRVWGAQPTDTLVHLMKTVHPPM